MLCIVYKVYERGDLSGDCDVYHRTSQRRYCDAFNIL